MCSLSLTYALPPKPHPQPVISHPMRPDLKGRMRDTHGPEKRPVSSSIKKRKIHDCCLCAHSGTLRASAVLLKGWIQFSRTWPLMVSPGESANVCKQGEEHTGGALRWLPSAVH